MIWRHLRSICFMMNNKLFSAISFHFILLWWSAHACSGLIATKHKMAIKWQIRMELNWKTWVGRTTRNNTDKNWKDTVSSGAFMRCKHSASFIDFLSTAHWLARHRALALQRWCMSPYIYNLSQAKMSIAGCALLIINEICHYPILSSHPIILDSGLCEHNISNGDAYLNNSIVNVAEIDGIQAFSVDKQLMYRHGASVVPTAVFISSILLIANEFSCRTHTTQFHRRWLSATINSNWQFWRRLSISLLGDEKLNVRQRRCRYEWARTPLRTDELFEWVSEISLNIISNHRRLMCVRYELELCKMVVRLVALDSSFWSNQTSADDVIQFCARLEY